MLMLMMIMITNDIILKFSINEKYLEEMKIFHNFYARQISKDIIN